MSIKINNLIPEFNQELEELSDTELHLTGGGILDGTLNNADLLSHIDLLNTSINSDVTTSENTNANTRADGSKNNSVSFSVSI
jgi:hypothetical protein